MSVVEHVLMMSRGFLQDGIRPDCSCGWSGYWHPTEEQAVSEWDEHCDTEFYESTMAGLDEEDTDG